MTRKRFVKLSQSRGLKRNAANIFAKEIQQLKLPYERFSHTTLKWLNDTMFIIEIHDYYAWKSYRHLEKRSFGTDPKEYDEFWARSPIAGPPVNSFVCVGAAFGFCI